MAGLVTLIPEDEKGELKSAAEVRTIAQGAEVAGDVIAVAKLINNAVNTGAMEVLVNFPLSEDVIDELETEGYNVTPYGLAVEASQYIVDWKE